MMVKWTELFPKIEPFEEFFNYSKMEEKTTTD